MKYSGKRAHGMAVTKRKKGIKIRNGETEAVRERESETE